MEIPEADSSSSMGSPGWLAVLDSLPTEQMNFLLGQICALPLALIFRKYLHPTKTNPIVRHAVATLLGFYLCMFCYGWCTVFILGEVIVSYVILLVSDRSRVHVYSLLFAMGYLTIFQINRLLDSSEESSDFTVPMMILTQKITKVAFELHDGTARPPESLSPSQKIQALRKLPSPLEYLSYNFNFMGILAGPLCSYNDYVSFIEGTHYQRGGDLDQLKENGTQKRSEPSPTNAVLEKVVTSFLLLAIHMTLSKVVPVAYNIEESFFGTAPLLHRLLYLYISLAACRPKYYIAWTLADAIHNAAGFGFSGYGKDGKPRWDLIRNLCIVRIELATSLKMFIDNWNIQTAVWLKEICYDRCAASPTLATFVLSAVWHGVHPGYYLTFLTGMLMTLAARAVRIAHFPSLLRAVPGMS
ncbi:membrane-bound O-acyltransferase domain-containing protein 2-like isoform X3 [Rhinatrema bivittatum]|uniref:membrane-bound O-acyltransferase domain-containing protein 2-like isoform X3 n=1 Tax=Rhinatrema bivittatum TaxID=194408 RepID=UPI00112DBEE5|nr:membrane-bound O-acyltransferase domain-containing protein 2-like isoform X3 [Rhinatrema bivittatum]